MDDIRKAGDYIIKQSMKIGGREVVLGEMGIMHPVIAKNIDKRKNFAVLELDIEKMLDTRVFLDLYVRVKENWRESARTVSNFGYRDEE